MKCLFNIAYKLKLLYGSKVENDNNRNVGNTTEGYFFTGSDGIQLFIYDFKPTKNYFTTIFVISGITGINHHTEKELINILSNGENRIVIIHPRGTGYSGGKRGNVKNIWDFINDYLQIITSDLDYSSDSKKIILFGHSMSTSILLAVANNLKKVSGAIMINPPFIQKKAEGMSPSIAQYCKYVFYYVFAKNTPVVNMSGDPSKIKNEEDRLESELRSKDPLLVKYFSLNTMTESKKIMGSMIEFSTSANYPLLLIYGLKDNIVEKLGCDMIYNNWKHPDKQYVLIQNGSHGKSTLIQAAEIITKWISNYNSKNKFKFVKDN